MLDIQFIVNNSERVRKGCRDKGVDPKIVDRLLKVDEQRRDLIKKIEDLRADRNKLTKADIQEGKKLKEDLKNLEPKLRKVGQEFLELIYQLPNLPLDNVPVGKDESENRLVKKVGKIPKFNFPVKDHFELGERLDWVDVKRAAKVSGSRFGYLKGQAVLIQFGLIQHGLKTLLKEGFTPLLPPVLIKDEMMKGMGYLEHGGDKETYFLDKDKLYLVGTAEQSVGPMHSGEIIDEARLALRYVAYSTCFRREAGTYGKDTRGIFRVHQFDKLEMFVFCHPADSEDELEHLLSLEERLVKDLGLPYRVVEMCTGDLGHPAAKKYDIECWFPSQEKYREVTSASSCTDFQARRLNIKFKRREGHIQYLHTLNATLFAQRLILAIMENYQQKDRTIKIPKILQKYVAKDSKKD